MRHQQFLAALAAAPVVWTPAMLGAKLWGWWDAAPSYITLDGSNNVQQWADRSGNARHFVNTTAPGNRPGYTASGINGKPSLTGAGGSWLNLASAWPASKRSIVFVFKSSATGYQGLACDTSGPDGWNYSANAWGLGIYSSDNMFYASTVFNQGASPGTAKALWEITADDAVGINTWLNGVQDINGNPAFHGQNSNLILMAGYGGIFSGQLAEVLILSDVLSGADQSSLRSYLNTKYAIF